MAENNYTALKLEGQLCFPMYAASREIIKTYRPFLAELGLTYTQYITMLVLWEEKKMNVKSMGKKLYLDSGTLTPMLKNLEAKGYVKRQRSKEDERVLNVEVTKKGFELREKALSIPYQLEQSINFSKEDAKALYDLLNKFLGK